MDKEINAKARIAFAVFLLIAIVSSVTWYVVSARDNRIYQISTHESVSGLIADAPVEFHGVEVGKVKSVKLLDPHTVQILLSVDKTAPITSASVATITSRGLASRGFTGYVYVAIEDVGTATTPLAGAPYPSIPTAPSKSMTLDSTFDQAAENVQAITGLLQSTLDEKTINALKQSASSLQQVTNALAANTTKLNAIVANTERASHRLGPLLNSGDDTIKGLRTQILPEAHKTLSKLDELSSSMSDVTTKIDRNPSILIRGSVPRVPGPGERK